MTFYQQFHEKNTDHPDFIPYLKKSEQLLTRIKQNFEHGAYPFLTILDQPIESMSSPFVEKVRDESRELYVLGTGGSSLGAKTLCELNHAYAVHSYKRPRVHFLENIDPRSFEVFLSEVNWQKASFLIVSKSGSTAETLFQFLTLIDKVPEPSFYENMAVITEFKDSPLFKLASEFGITLFPHPLDIGGRFSVFSVVGLLPAKIAEVDHKAVCDGAWAQLHSILNHEKSFVEGLAVLLQVHDDPRYSEVVMMPYLDRMVSFSFWFRQLWAESLGKNGKGMTPIQSLGTVDQHSLLQLYADGPKNKVFNIVGQRSFKTDLTPHVIYKQDDRLSYMSETNMGDLMRAEQLATIQSLRNQGNTVREFTFDELNESTLGALLVHQIIEVIALALYLNIDAFDQPAVEESKILTKEYLKRLRASQ